MSQRPVSPTGSSGAEARRRQSPWPKVLFTAFAGAGGILASGVGVELMEPSALLLALVGPPLGILLLEVSLALTAAMPLRAVTGAARLLLRWHKLPRGAEPFLWTVLVVVAEEGIFRLAAFAWLPVTWWSIVAVSLVFTFLHLPRILGRKRPLRVGAASFLLSVALCMAYVVSSSFWLVVAAHLVHNLALNTLRDAVHVRKNKPGDGSEADKAQAQRALKKGDQSERETM